jgi:hypothetical protein
VEPLRASEGEKALPHTIGAVIHVRATPGMTAEWIDRVVSCDIVRRSAASCGGADGCAIAPFGVSHAVTSGPTGFAIALTSSDRETALEIDKRARAFTRLSAGP